MEAGVRYAPRAATATLVRPRAGVRTVVSDCFQMTKPKVQTLLLLTTITTMYVAGDPSLSLVFLTCLGGALSAGGAGGSTGGVRLRRGAVRGVVRAPDTRGERPRGRARPVRVPGLRVRVHDLA